ncbi:DUF167 domain-containing protein [Legionella sp. CNM-4043-24]|uniref:DUF167 domain-containing protein n=1 Tax=Legionella sp. CNM-4043-24 TaxID=3421646 RepID=UPI00403AB856
MSWYRLESDVLILRLYVQPGARHNELIGLIGDELKLRLMAPPIEGRANAVLVKYLAQLFEVPRSDIQLKSGEKSRHKTIVIRGSKVHPESILTT